MKQLATFILLAISFKAQSIGLTEYLSLPANPLKINIGLDSERVSKKISASVGGTIALTTRNGDTFELSLPPKSLLQDTEISLQKIKSINSPKLPAANYSSVEISPDGLELLVPATLTFKPKQAFPIETLTPFSAQATGDETQLITLKGTPALHEIKVGLLHFSNYTITDGPTADEIIENGLAQNETTRISTWLNRKILQNKRNGSDSSQEVDAAFKESFDNVILPSILRVNSCATGSYALNNFTTWKRQLEILGKDARDYFPSDFETSLNNMLTDTTEQCFELAKKACYQDHAPREVLVYALRFMRMGALFNIDEIYNRFSNLFNKCSRFKFFMESELWAGQTRSDSVGVTAKSEFNFNLGINEAEGAEGKIEVIESDFNIKGFICEKTSSQTAPSPLTLSNFLFQKQPESVIKMGGLVPQSMAHFRCMDRSKPPQIFESNVPPSPMTSFWGGMFMAAHGPTGLNEWDMNTGLFNIKGWEMRNDVKMATKEYSQRVQGAINETTSMTIYHTPDPL